MSFVLLMAMTAAVAASFGYLAARRKPGEGGDERGTRDSAHPTEEQGVDKQMQKKRLAEQSPFEGLPFSLGDVVIADGDERWLAGAIVAREDEERVLGALFLAPEGSAQRAVAVFAAPRTDIYWLSPVDLASPGEPPATIEIAGAALRRRGRLPVTLERHGQGAPSVEAEGIWATYDGGGKGVALVLTSGGKTFAFSGKRLEEGEYDRLGGGG
jgi:hypothetical protein